MKYLSVGAILLALSAGRSPAAEPDRQGVEFFEKKIRPVLVNHCYACHSGEAEARGKLRGELRLDTRTGIAAGGENGPAVVARDKDSLLLKALRHDGPKMPPKQKLPAGVIADFEKWVEMGAPVPETNAVASGPGQRARDHWAFQPIRRPPVPAVKELSRVQSPVDAFILARLERAGLTLAPPADRATLLRRTCFDLTGLPPTPDEIAAFVRDSRPGACDALTGRLLASPHYGERYGRHWLDVARYADSAGYEIDNFYNHAFKYRDYVIASLNADKGFDRFVCEQLAGDELWPGSDEARVGTSFLTIGPYAFEGGIARPEVVEYQRLTDLADTTSEAFFGLTLGCARCHNHKFDPISQADYFGIQAVFAASKPRQLPTDKPDPNGAANMTLVHVDRPPTTRLLRRGDIDAPTTVVPPAMPRALPRGGEVPESAAAGFKRRRAALAQWLTEPDNPLTARVIANRVWQWHFGQGLVRTPNDFGTQGEPPSHPELLDWLACELRDNGWSLKHLHRVIMCSAVYQASGVGSPESVRRDADNRLLARFPRRRLEAEAIWDNLHATAGSIDLRMFGPAVYAPIDKDILNTKLNMKWEAERFRDQWARRGVYLVVRRSLVFPFFETFNVIPAVNSAGRRDSTVVAPQALELMNSPVALLAARTFARRLLRECGPEAYAIAERAWLLAFGRPITAVERKRATAFLRSGVLLQPTGGPALAVLTGPPAEAVASEWPGRTLIAFCQAVMNANEFVYVD